MKHNKNPVTAVTRELAKHDELKAALEAVYTDLDPQALADTLQGETDLDEVLQRVAAQVLDYEALAKATQERIADLQARKARLVKTAETLRTIILQAMDTAEIPKITGPEMTLSCRQTKGALVVDDESQLPSECFEPQPPKLSGDRLKKAWLSWIEKQNEQLGENPKADIKPFPGAHLSNGALSLTIRVE